MDVDLDLDLNLLLRLLERLLTEADLERLLPETDLELLLGFETLLLELFEGVLPALADFLDFSGLSDLLGDLDFFFGEGLVLLDFAL